LWEIAKQPLKDAGSEVGSKQISTRNLYGFAPLNINLGLDLCEYSLYIKGTRYDKNIYLQYFDIVNSNTHTKFFLIASELVQLAEEAKRWLGQ